ncbi:MAG: CNNM domain-containing protein, partial [Eubacteriales bacterium]
MKEKHIIYIAVMTLCLVMSGYFSATETAFSSLNRTRLKTMAEKGNKKASLAVKLSEKYDKLISTILIGNNVVNIALSSLGTVLFLDLFGDIGA